MKPLPTGWKNAVRREMRPSWFGWVLIAALGGLTVAWVRGVGADLFYPVQYAVAFGISGQVQLEFFSWLTICAMWGAYVAFGPIMAFIPCGVAMWSGHARSWAVWLLLLWGLSIFPMGVAFGRWHWRVYQEHAQTFVIFNFIGWVGFVILSWFMTRSRWVIAGLLTLWLLQRNEYWFGAVALRSILWHAGLFAVFFGWALRKRMAAMPVSTVTERPVQASHADAAMVDPRARLA